MNARLSPTALSFPLAAALAAALVAGCAAAGPNYAPPEAPLPAEFSVPAQGPVESRPGAGNAGWWKSFEDPALDELAARAAANNRDLRVAAARVLEARALRGLADSDRFPSLGGKAGYRALRLSETGLETANLPSAGGPVAFDFDPTQELWEAGFDASWEADLFGRVSRSVEAADADLEAADARLDGALWTLLAEVARNYVALRETQAKTALTLENLEAQRRSLGLTRKKFEGGLGNRLDVARAEALAADTETRLPLLASREANLRHRLATLLGEPPDALSDLLSAPAPVPVPPAEVVAGMPADLLRSRPDIREAERTLAAQTARIGVAEADLYPRLRFNGSIGISTTDLAGFDPAESWTGSIGPSFSWALLEGGAIRARIAAADARAQQALARYEQTVLLAVEEAENAFSSHAEDSRRRELAARSVEANREALRLATRLYEGGLGDFLGVLDSQRQLLAAEERLAESRANLSASFIAIQKAMGGAGPVAEGTAS